MSNGPLNYLHDSISPAQIQNPKANQHRSKSRANILPTYRYIDIERESNTHSRFDNHHHKDLQMAPPPGPYSGTSALALVARASAFSFGLVYGSIKLKYLQAKAKSHKKAEEKAHP